MSNPLSLALVPYSLQKTPLEFIEPMGVEENIISSLPDEIMVSIFSSLDLQSLSRCSIVCQNWKQISSDKFLWRDIFAKTNLSHVKTRFSLLGEEWKYRDLASTFITSRRFGIAISACEKSAKLDAVNGAYGFKDLCRKACDLKEYTIALEFQKLAKQYCSDAGNESMCCLIKHQVADSNFLEKFKSLVEQSIALVDENREFGLQALMTIAKKFADLQRFPEAMNYTQVAQTLSDSKSCERERNRLDIDPMMEMSQHMLHLKRYTLAEEYARKINKQHCRPGWCYADIIIKQIEEENFINESLIAELEPETGPWIRAYKGLIFGIIDKGRYDEAQKFAKTLLASEAKDIGKYEFKQKFEKITKLVLDTGDA